MSGKNLCDTSFETLQSLNTLGTWEDEIYTREGLTFTPKYTNNLLDYIEINGTATADVSFQLGKITPESASTSYSINGCPTGGSTSTYRLWLDNIGGDMGEGKSGAPGVTTTLNCFINVKSGTTVTNLQFKPMVRLTSVVDSTYEPYCGAVASPNPDYPQEIQNVEGRSCRNIFNIPNGNGAIRGVSYIVDNQQIKLNGTINGDPWLVITANSVSGVNGTPSSAYLVGKIDGALASGVVKGFVNYISGIPNTTPTMRLYDIEGNLISEMTEQTQVGAVAIYLGTTGKVFENYIIGIQINEGTAIKSYEPYFAGKQFDIVVNNENLAWNGWAEDCVKRVNYAPGAKIEQFDNRNCLMFAPNTGYGEYDTKYLFKIKFRENTRYTFVFDIYNTAVNANLVIHYTDGTKANFAGVTANTWQRVIYTSASNKTIKYITPAYYSGNKHIDLDTFMVLEGVYTAENLPNYIPNQQKTIPFPLAAGQKLMEGDYLADDGIHHTRDIVVLTGTELFQKNQVYDNVFFVDNILKPRAENLNALCNYFTYGGEKVSSANLELNKFYSWGTDGYNRRLVFCIEMETRDEFKAWLAEQYANGTPLIVEYGLAEEVIDPYTEAQQEAYNQLKKLMLHYGVNHIWTETDGLEPNLQLTYYKSNKLVLENLESRVAALENE